MPPYNERKSTRVFGGGGGKEEIKEGGGGGKGGEGKHFLRQIHCLFLKAWTLRVGKMCRKDICRFLLVRFKGYEILKPMKIHIFHGKMQ